MEKLDGRYQLVEKIGQGGLGEVYKAYDELLKREVAIKLVTADYAREQASQRDLKADLMPKLRHEAYMMALLHHPNIMPIYDCGESEGYSYLVMPLVSGRLDYLLKNVRERPLIDSVQLLQRIATGLDFIHSQQVVHRDIKATNILIGEANQPYITNMGLAQRADPTSLPAEVHGTLAYMAPEVLAGEPASARSDLYAFGMLVFELLTGVHPFDTSDFTALIHDIMTCEVPSIAEHRPELSALLVHSIDPIIAKLTAKDPGERYTSASAAVDDLYSIVYSGQKIIDGKLFISYARQDEDFVHQLAEELRRFNVDVWIDRNIEFGSEWDTSIEQQLSGCDMMVVIATPASIKSYYVTYEWSYFFGAGKPVFPFVPEEHAEDLDLHPRLQRVQYIKGTESLARNASLIIDVMNQANIKRKNGGSSHSMTSSPSMTENA